MKLTKTEKLITILMLECLRSKGFHFEVFRHNSILVAHFLDDEITQLWDVYSANGQYNNAEIIKVIKAVRKFKEGL